jgi:peptidoglycan/LPS O-acetylase OafA/YrhL
MGNLSYALYLTHVFIVETMRRVVDFEHGPGAMLTILILSVILAGGTYYLIERPMTVALRKWLLQPGPRTTPGTRESRPQSVREALLDLSVGHHVTAVKRADAGSTALPCEDSKG